MKVRCDRAWIHAPMLAAIGLACGCSSSSPAGGVASGEASGSSAGASGSSGAAISGGAASGASGAIASAGATSTSGASMVGSGASTGAPSGSAAAGASGAATGATASSGNGSSGTMMVGVAGGTVTQDGVVLAVPANAVSTNVALTVTPTTAPSGYLTASQAYQFGPAGTTFAQPVTVTIPLTTAAPAHLFWSNASGGFDDIGGAINGSTIVGQVTHFSIGFAAIPNPTTDASAPPNDAGTGSDGASSAGSETGAPGDAAGGTNDGTLPASDAAASSEAGAPTDAASAPDGLTADAAAALCAPYALNAIAQVFDSDAAAPAPSSYSGGALQTGSYRMNLVTQYGGATYAGPVRVEYIFDTSAKTMRLIQDPGTGALVYTGLSYAIANGPVIAGTVVCSTAPNAPGTMSWYYTWTGSDAGYSSLSLNAVGSTTVLGFVGP